MLPGGDSAGPDKAALLKILAQKASGGQPGDGQPAGPGSQIMGAHPTSVYPEDQQWRPVPAGDSMATDPQSLQGDQGWLQDTLDNVLGRRGNPAYANIGTNDSWQSYLGNADQAGGQWGANAEQALDDPSNIDVTQAFQNVANAPQPTGGDAISGMDAQSPEMAALAALLKQYLTNGGGVQRAGVLDGYTEDPAASIPGLNRTSYVPWPVN